MTNDRKTNGLSLVACYKNNSHLKAFQRFIKKTGVSLRFRVATDAAHVRACLEEEAPDCVLMEIELGESPVPVCACLRESDVGDSIPILLMTEVDNCRPLWEQLIHTGFSNVYVAANSPSELVTAITIITRAKYAGDALCASNRSLAQLAQDRSRALQESEERYRFLFNSCSDGVMTFEMDSGTPRLLDVNDVTCRWLGYSREELLHIPLRQLTIPDRMNNVRGRLESILQHNDLFFETVLRAKNGSNIPLEIMTRSCALDNNRHVVIALGKRVKSPDLHHKRNGADEEYNYFAAQTGQMIYDCELETGRVLWGGAVAQVSGFSSGQLARAGWEGWQERIVPEDRPRVKSQIADAMNIMGKYQIEYRINHKSGEIRHIEDNGVTLPDASGKACRLFGAVKDITARTQTEEKRRRHDGELQHSQRLESLGVLAGGIAHDFNNILAGIIGLTDLALRQIPTESLAYGDLTEALQAANRAKELVKQILAFSRQSGQERNPIYPHIIAREVIKLLRASLPSAIEIIDNADSHSGAVMANTAQLYQIITNFATNAAQAMEGQNGKLEICVRDVDVDEAMAERHPALQAGPYVELAVRDTGHGMAPSVLARVFDPFFTTKGPGHGSGMGLAVAHGIIADHGGAVWAESKLGAGSTFYAWLPRIAGVMVEEFFDNSKLQRGHERILFVDDDAAVLRFAESALPRQGFTLTLCRNGEEGLKTFFEYPDKFDLIITDQIMPKMSGEELASQIHIKHPEIPIILFTGFSEELSWERLRQVGIREVVLKPIIVKDLIDAIRRAIDEEKK